MAEDNTYYQGNPFLKKSHTPIVWTKEMIEELKKCAKDSVYFTENYINIVHSDRDLIRFDLYDWQKEMHYAMNNRRYSAFCVARQSGKSVAVGAWLLWYIMFHKRKNVVILANKGDTATEVLGYIKNMYIHIPRWLQQGVEKWQEKTFALENGSRITAGTTTPDNVRGHRLNILYLDEAAHIENWDTFWAAAFPAITAGKTTKVIMTSTPYGLNHFYNIIENSKKPETDPEYNGYYTIEVPWHRIPGRDEAWKKDTLQGINNDYERFEQEFNIQFLGSSGTLIAGWKLKEMFSNTPIHWNKDGLKQYAKPEKEHNYVMVCDVSRGKGLDYSAFQIIDISQMPYNLVATFRCNFLTPGDYASIIHSTAKLYNNAFVLVEINDIGEQVGYALMMDFEYDNVLLTENRGARGKRLVSGFGSAKADKGVRTTKLVKNVGCSMLKMLIEENQLIVHDKDTIDELKRFSRKNQTYEAEPGCTDDLVMCLVLFAWMTKEDFFKELTNIHTLAKLRERSEAQVEQDVMPFGFLDDGKEDDLIVTDVDVWEPVWKKSGMFNDAF